MYYSVCPERTSRKTEKGTFEPNARPFMPRGGLMEVLELDLPTCPALELEWG